MLDIADTPLARGGEGLRVPRGALGMLGMTAVSQLPGLSRGGHGRHSPLLPHGLPNRAWKQRRRDMVGCTEQPCSVNHPETALA